MENGGTSVGIRCKEGVVLAVEKVVTSKLLKQGVNKRIATVDRHLGVVSLPSIFNSLPPTTVMWAVPELRLADPLPPLRATNQTDC